MLHTNINLDQTHYTLHAKNNDFGIAHIFFIAAVFTSSFDIFLVFNIGFNFRITQILLLIPIGLSVIKAIRDMVFHKPVGFNWLLLWTMFIIAFVPNTSFLLRSIGYAAWLVFDVFAIFTCVQFFSTPSKTVSLFRWYVYSFVFVAIFGLIQFLSPLAGLGDALLISQWWIPDILPRINGFSYEPSFFATYLLMGWVVCAYLLESKTALFPQAHLWFYYIIISLSLVLSSSRMGILMMAIWYMQYPLRFIGRISHGFFHKRFAAISLMLFGIASLLISLAVYVVDFDNISFLLSGLGIFDSAAHSVITRVKSTIDTLSLFINSPFIGYSLGGIGPAIAKMHGVTSVDFEVVKEFEGNSIFVEVLAASGIFGFIPFVMYVLHTILKPLRLAQKVSSEHSKIMVALTLSLIFELAILQFNQIILRPYLWMHLAVLAACYSAFKPHSKIYYLQSIHSRGALSI